MASGCVPTPYGVRTYRIIGSLGDVRTRITRPMSQFTNSIPKLQILRLWLKASLNTNSNGWVPSEVWDAAKDAHFAAFDKKKIPSARGFKACGKITTVVKTES